MGVVALTVVAAPAVSLGSTATAAPDVAPTASISGSCSSASVTMNAGSEATSFHVDPAGASPATDVSVPAQSQVVQQYAVDAGHPNVTVSDGAAAGARPLASYTRPASCDGQGSQSAVDPKVVFSASCDQGIVVVLSNMKLDDTTTAPVTFTVVTPAGKTEQVEVKADHIIKRAYDIADHTTGVVTVSAPGMATTSKSYSKLCTKVLGEKVTRTPATRPAARRAAQLPMTGLSPGIPLLLAAALLIAGLALGCAGGRHRDRV